MQVNADGSQGLFSDAADWVIGINNDTFLSRFATIWRWRQAYQYDFAARMQWTINGNYANVNHEPYAVVNGSCGTLQIPYTLGQSVVLDASASWDPDGDSLSFDWFHYREPTFRLEGDIPRISPNVTFDLLDDGGSIVNVTPNDNVVSGDSILVEGYNRSLTFDTLTDHAHHSHSTRRQGHGTHRISACFAGSPGMTVATRLSGGVLFFITIASCLFFFLSFFLDLNGGHMLTT